MRSFMIAGPSGPCPIVISANAPETASYAAGELRRLLAMQCGVEPDLRCGAPVPGAIVLGAHSEGLEIEELRIRVVDGALCVDGGKRGLIYGVYELLENLGFRFFAEDCEKVPADECLSLPADTDIRQKPLFEYRCTSWIAATQNTLQKMRLNAYLGGDIPAQYGGGHRYIGFVHTLGELAEMEKIDGEYTDRQPCLTSEDTYQKVIKNLRKRLGSDPGEAIASVSQNDSHAWSAGCQCENCKKLDEREGTPMGSLLTFVNRVADELGPEFPDLAIDTLSYAYARKAPKTIRPSKNVIIRTCTPGVSVTRPISVEAPDFVENLEQWAKLTDRIYIWDYTTNFNSYHNPFPNLRVIRENVRFFADHNVKGVFEQGDQQTVNGEFGVLRAYLFGKLLWDPYMDEETYNRHIDEFLEGYYGAGWRHIRAFIDRLHDDAGVISSVNYVDPPRIIYDRSGDGTTLERAGRFLEMGRADFAAAMKEADPVSRRRIAAAAAQLDLYEWYLLYDAYQVLDEGDPARGGLKDRLYTTGQRLYARALSSRFRLMYEDIFARTSFGEKGVNYLSNPADWGKPARELGKEQLTVS